MAGSAQQPLDERVLRLEVDALTDRQITWLRAGLGLLILPCAAWLFTLPERGLWVVAAFGLVFALLWLVRGARALRAKPAEPDFLLLDRTGLRLREHGSDRAIAWLDVTGIGTDEDRLTVVLALRAAADFHIEPRYREMPLETLRETLVRFWQARDPAPDDTFQSPDARPETGG